MTPSTTTSQGCLFGLTFITWEMFECSMCLFDVLTKCTARACLLLVSNIYSKHFHLLMYFLKFTFLHYTLFFIFDLVFEKILYTVENDLMCARWRFNDPYSVIRIEIRVDPPQLILELIVSMISSMLLQKKHTRQRDYSLHIFHRIQERFHQDFICAPIG